MYLMITLGTTSYALRISDSLTGNHCATMRKKKKKKNEKSLMFPYGI